MLLRLSNLNLLARGIEIYNSFYIPKPSFRLVHIIRLDNDGLTFFMVCYCEFQVLFFNVVG